MVLKDYPFVPDTTQEGPYTVGDTYISDGWRNVVYWITKVLESTKMATTIDNKAARNYRFTTSANWFNQNHDDDEIDPLKHTRWRAHNWYKVVDEDASNLKYKALTVYQVLESICKTWGMRVVYWNHTFVFVDGSIVLHILYRIYFPIWKTSNTRCSFRSRHPRSLTPHLCIKCRIFSSLE